MNTAADFSNVALILIDVQRGFDHPRWGTRNNLDAEANIARLLGAWRTAKRPVIHVRHMSVEPDSPLRPGQEGNDWKPEVVPLNTELIVEKTVNSALIGTELENHLRTNGIDIIVIVGLTTDHCVSTTTRMAGNLGFNVYLVADACATFNRTTYDGKNISAQDVHDSALASLHGEFATVVTTDDLLTCRTS